MQVVDLQVLCVRSMSTTRPARHLPGMARALSDILPPDVLADAERIKAHGKTLFAPERGGSYDVWTQRPLSPALVEYAAADVLHMFTMHTRWSAHMLEATACSIAAGRMCATIERAIPWPRGRMSKWSEIDF
jgi:exonuclease 3'-5' domain-containing protein 1